MTVSKIIPNYHRKKVKIMTVSADLPSQSENPLKGLTVIELGHSVAAPYAGQILNDLGATVIKIENPDGGDDARNWGPPFWGEASATFQSLNRNKRSVVVDIKNAEERQQLKELMLSSDVILQNMRPGLVEKFGLDSNSLRKENSKLIYCNLGAFGRTGPLKNKTGYDPLIQAFSGIMSVTGEAGRPPVRVGPSIVDQGAGMWSVIGILSALLRREHSSQGCTVDTSLFETALAWMTVPMANAAASSKELGRSGSETPMLVPYKAYRAQDRHIVIAAGNDNLFRRLCVVLGRSEWASDARFVTNSDRIKNRSELNALISDVVICRSSEDWVSDLDAANVPCAPLQTVSEVRSHPQTKALGILNELPDGKMCQVGLPLSFDTIRPEIVEKFPTLGNFNLEDVAYPEKQP